MGRLRALVATVAVTASMAAGCGGGGGGAGGSGEFCAVARTFEAKFRPLLTANGPDAAKSFWTSAQQGLTDLNDSAPAAIKGDIEVMISAYRQLLDALRQVDYELPRVPPGVLRGLDAPAVATAGDRLGTYLRTECGVAD